MLSHQKRGNVVENKTLEEATIEDITKELASRPLAFAIVAFEQDGNRHLNFNTTKLDCLKMLDMALEYMCLVTDEE
jgi:hypothetical protein